MKNMLTKYSHHKIYFISSSIANFALIASINMSFTSLLLYSYEYLDRGPRVFCWISLSCLIAFSSIIFIFSWIKFTFSFFESFSLLKYESSFIGDLWGGVDASLTMLVESLRLFFCSLSLCSLFFSFNTMIF